MDTYAAPYRLQLYLPDHLRDQLHAIVKREATTQQRLLTRWLIEKMDEYQYGATQAPDNANKKE